MNVETVEKWEAYARPLLRQISAHNAKAKDGKDIEYWPADGDKLRYWMFKHAKAAGRRAIFPVVYDMMHQFPEHFDKRQGSDDTQRRDRDMGREIKNPHADKDGNATALPCCAPLC